MVEIAFNDLQASPHYPGGLALRFARVKAYRPDKRAEDADTIATVRAIYARQGADPAAGRARLSSADPERGSCGPARSPAAVVNGALTKSAPHGSRIHAIVGIRAEQKRGPFVGRVERSATRQSGGAGAGVGRSAAAIARHGRALGFARRLNPTYGSSA